VFHTIGKNEEESQLQEYICFLDEENDTTKKVIISVLKHTAVALLLGQI